jgi:hypothetical protein
VLQFLVFNYLIHGSVEELARCSCSSEVEDDTPVRERTREGRCRNSERFLQGPARNAFAARSATARIMDFKKASISQGRKTAPALNETWCPERPARAGALGCRSNGEGGKLQKCVTLAVWSTVGLPEAQIMRRI